MFGLSLVLCLFVLLSSHGKSEQGFKFFRKEGFILVQRVQPLSYSSLDNWCDQRMKLEGNKMFEK